MLSHEKGTQILEIIKIHKIFVSFVPPLCSLYLKIIPIKNHYEQECNAAALKKLGVPVIYDVTDDFNLIIENWLNMNIVYPKMKANNINQTLEYLLGTYKK